MQLSPAKFLFNQMFLLPTINFKASHLLGFGIFSDVKYVFWLLWLMPWIKISVIFHYLEALLWRKLALLWYVPYRFLTSLQEKEIHRKYIFSGDDGDRKVKKPNKQQLRLGAKSASALSSPFTCYAKYNSSYFPCFPLLVFALSTNLKVREINTLICRKICYTEWFPFWGIIRCAGGN